MTLSSIWNTYTEGDYLNSLRLSVEALADAAGIDLLHIAGLSLMNLRRCDEAIILLNAAITLRPQSPHIYVNAAYLAESAGRKHDAQHFAEAGLKDFEVTTWYGVMAPAGTPRPIITRLNGELGKIMHTPDVKERLAGMATDPLTSTPEEFAAYLKQEIAKWGDVVRKAHLKAD